MLRSPGTYTRPVISIKDVFFPPTEVLFTIEKIGNEVNIRETSPEGEQVLFGVRPCDAHGLQALDALFIATQPIDPYYMRRRENTTLVGLACPEMGRPVSAQPWAALQTTPAIWT